MKNTRFESNKILKATQPRRVPGMEVRSGLKAGRRLDAGNVGGGMDPDRGGGRF